VAGIATITDAQQMSDAVRVVYRLTVRRAPADEEIDIWLTHFRNGVTFDAFVTGMAKSQEAAGAGHAQAVSPEKTNAAFVMDLYRLVQGRGCTIPDMQQWARQIQLGHISRTNLALNFLADAQAVDAANADSALHDGLSCWIMGTSKTLTLAEWETRAKDHDGLARARAALAPRTPFVIKAEPGIRVSCIASLFKGGAFVEQFMDNITGQSCFDRHCELIIVDANSPENEAEVIQRYADRHKGVRYLRTSTTIGIYEAWNIAARMAQGLYLTNTNLDDLRRRDSLEIQAGALDALPFVDVVYQDFYYSFDPRLGWNDVAAFGYKSSLPIITNANMLAYNSPHNAPMWRKTLHDEVGFFDPYFRSAGDYDFWLRCLVAGKQFYKINEPHVVYYQNPQGLSTRADTKGVLEAKAISRKYMPLLVSPELIGPFGAFAETALGNPAAEEEFGDLTRYEIVQQALRAASVRFKTGGR
jgi:hypothetical protein